jgi:hypothetical protein
MRKSRIENPLDQEVEEIGDMQFRTEQHGSVTEEREERVSIISCDTRDL